MPPVNPCVGCLVAWAVLTVLLVPGPLVMDSWGPPAPQPASLDLEDVPFSVAAKDWFESTVEQFPQFDLFATVVLLLLGLVIYIFECIQRKLMEKRIAKLNSYLCASIEKLRAWDTQQEQLEATLKLAQNATNEYNLLLYLLLRQHHCLDPQQSRDWAFEKDLDEMSFLRNATLQV